MARVLFSVRSNIIWDHQNPQALDPFYEGFIQELINFGNDVLLIRTNNIIDAFNSKLNPDDTRYFQNVAKKFDPEIIITPNHSIPKCILETTDCPVIVIGADSLPYYSDKEYIRQNIGRYIFAHHDLGMSFAQACCEVFGAQPDQNRLIGYATSVQAETLPIKQNIVFMGILGWTYFAQKKFIQIKDAQELQKFWLDYETGITDKKKLDIDMLHVLTANSRIKTLDALSDLGLKCYGYINAYAAALPYSINLAKCFDIAPKYKVKDIQDEFNSSLIAPTLFNAQATSGFSWRVCDVMASNARLIAPPQKDICQFSPYVEIPFYESPAEARELCQKLIKDNVWRSEIVAGSQKAVNEKWRFINMFRRFEEISPVSLTSKPAPEHKAEYIVLGEKKNKSVRKRRLKKKIKLIFYAFLFLLSLLPLSGSFLKKKKILKKINKTMEK